MLELENQLDESRTTSPSASADSSAAADAQLSANAFRIRIKSLERDLQQKEKSLEKFQVRLKEQGASSRFYFFFLSINFNDDVNEKPDDLMDGPRSFWPFFFTAFHLKVKRSRIECDPSSNGPQKKNLFPEHAFGLVAVFVVVALWTGEGHAVFR